MKQPKYVLGEIISPGFPGDYDNNLDVTWLLEAQIGQMIEINFLDFDGLHYFNDHQIHRTNIISLYFWFVTY